VFANISPTLKLVPSGHSIGHSLKPTPVLRETESTPCKPSVGLAGGGRSLDNSRAAQ